MTPETRRRIVTSVVLLIASIVLVIGFLRPQSAEEPTNGTDATTTIASSSESSPKSGCVSRAWATWTTRGS